jgi:hypothetical protein
MNCPKCDTDISDSLEEDDFSCGVTGGWYCDACDLAVAEWEVEREPIEGDVPITPASRRPDSLGTPISELSGQPDQPGYNEFCRIARSWGYN